MCAKDLAHELMKEPPKCHSGFKQEFNVHTREIRNANMN